MLAISLMVANKFSKVATKPGTYTFFLRTKSLRCAFGSVKKVYCESYGHYNASTTDVKRLIVSDGKRQQCKAKRSFLVNAAVTIKKIMPCVQQSGVLVKQFVVSIESQQQCANERILQSVALWWLYQVLSSIDRPPSSMHLHIKTREKM